MGKYGKGKATLTKRDEVFNNQAKNDVPVAVPNAVPHSYVVFRIFDIQNDQVGDHNMDWGYHFACANQLPP